MIILRAGVLTTYLMGNQNIQFEEGGVFSIILLFLGGGTEIAGGTGKLRTPQDEKATLISETRTAIIEKVTY